MINLTRSILAQYRLPTICAFLLLFYIVLNVIYNLFFHPLAKVPGPFFARISTIPSFYHACKGDRHLWLYQLFQTYGYKIRIYPDGIVYNDPSTYSQIYSYKANVRRSDFYKSFQRNKQTVNTFNAVDNAVHSKKRRLLNLVFTDKAVRSAGVFINKHVDRWDELIQGDRPSEWSEPRNIGRWVDCLVFDILGDLCFGRSFEIKEPGDNPLKAIPHALDDHARFMYRIARSPFLHTFIWFNHHGFDRVSKKMIPKAIKDYFEFVMTSVKDRLAQESELEKRREAGEEVRTDMFHYIAQAKEPDSGQPAYSPQELFAEAHLLIAAGSDTMTTALCGFFFYVSQNTRVYHKLVEEIRSTFSSPDEIVASSKLFGCQYLRACLDEAMRLTPSGPSELSRTILPGGMEIDGDYLPEGITVGHSNYCTARNEAHFEKANSYRPERWIVDEKTGVTEEMVAEARSCFPGFSSGPFNCVGKNLALLEMMTIMGRTLHRLDMRRAPGMTVGMGHPDLEPGRRDSEEYQLQDAFIATVDGPMLQFRARSK